MSQIVNKFDYYRDVKSYISNLPEYRLKSETHEKQGDKHIAMHEVGGRFYKKFVFKYTGSMDDINEWNMDIELEMQIEEDVNIMQQRSRLSQEYFLDSDTEAHCVVHAGCEDSGEKTVWVKPHIIPNPE